MAYAGGKSSESDTYGSPKPLIITAPSIVRDQTKIYLYYLFLGRGCRAAKANPVAPSHCLKSDADLNSEESIESIAAIVVNYGTPQLCIDLLHSLEKDRPELLRVLIVDNASVDDSASLIAEAIRNYGWEHWVELVCSPHNRGFGAGNNFGVNAVLKSESKPQLLWLLNPDTVFEATDLRPALRSFETDANVAIVGTGLVDVDRSSQLAGHRDPSPLGEFVQNAGAFQILRKWSMSDPTLERPGPLDWVSGASLIIRTSVFGELGGFDEGFFLYFEEVDLCRRARQAGWKIIYEPRTQLVHLEGGSTGVGQDKPVSDHWYRSRRRYFMKHHGRLGLLAADLCWTVGRAIGWLRGRPARCDWKRLWSFDGPVIFGRGELILNHVRS